MAKDEQDMSAEDARRLEQIEAVAAGVCPHEYPDYTLENWQASFMCPLCGETVDSW
jgi:hypothetical protein